MAGKEIEFQAAGADLIGVFTVRGWRRKKPKPTTCETCESPIAVGEQYLYADPYHICLACAKFDAESCQVA